MTYEELKALKIQKPNYEIGKKVKRRWDNIAKPLDSLGEFEAITVRIGSIIESEEIKITSKSLIIMCADNGIVEEGVSQSGQEITSIMAQGMAQGESCVCKMAKVTNTKVKIIDIGVNNNLQKEGIIHKKIAYGTKNFLKEPAMSRDEAMQAITIGIEAVRECKKEGCQIIAMGEMGIGNTTTSAAMAVALIGCMPDEVTGRGAGLNNEGLLRKKELIKKALRKYNLSEAEPIDILSSVGGFDIAGLVGVCMGGAICRIPIVIDGVISAVAALTAYRIIPEVKEFLIPSHESKEPASKIIMNELQMQPVINGNMALGEGTGAVMMFSLLDIILSVYERQACFGEMGITQYSYKR